MQECWIAIVNTERVERGRRRQFQRESSQRKRFSSRVEDYVVLFSSIAVGWRSHPPLEYGLQTRISFIGTRQGHAIPRCRGRHGCAGAVITQNTAQLIPFRKIGGVRALRNVSSHPEVSIGRNWLASIRDRIRFNNDMIALSDTNKYRSVRVAVDRNKISAYDCEVVVVDREDKCGVKGGVYQAKEISLRSRVSPLLKRDPVRLRYWKLGWDAGESCDIPTAI